MRLGSQPVGTELIIPRVGVLLSFGHSFLEGVTGPSKRKARISTRLAAKLGATDFNYARNSSLVNLGTDEIITRILQMVVPRSTATKSASGEYQPLSHVAIVWGGANDMATVAANSTSYHTVKAGLTTGICRLRQGAFFKWNDASVVLAQGTAAANWVGAGSNLMTGANVAQQGGNGNTFTINVPAAFPGGEIDISTLVGPGAGCVYTLTLDGGAIASWDTRGDSNAGGVWEANTYRLLGVAAGAHQIIGTVTQQQGGGDFLDGWGWAHPDPGLVVVPGQPRGPAYPFINYAPTDQDVLNLNAAVQSVVNGFTDGRVVYVDMDAAFGANANLFYSDNVHPNDAGQQAAEDAIYKAIVAAWPQGATLGKAQPPSSDARLGLRLVEQSSGTGAKDNRSGEVALANGAATVTNRVVQTADRIILSRRTAGAAPGFLSYSISAGASFTISSSSATDNGVIEWMIVSPEQP